jgi:hypothetical protein
MWVMLPVVPLADHGKRTFPLVMSSSLATLVWRSRPLLVVVVYQGNVCWCLSSGVPFQTPEQFFLDSTERIHTDFSLWTLGVHPAQQFRPKRGSVVLFCVAPTDCC